MAAAIPLFSLRSLERVTLGSAPEAAAENRPSKYRTVEADTEERRRISPSVIVIGAIRVIVRPIWRGNRISPRGAAIRVLIPAGSRRRVISLAHGLESDLALLGGDAQRRFEPETQNRFGVDHGRAAMRAEHAEAGDRAKSCAYGSAAAAADHASDHCAENGRRANGRDVAVGAIGARADAGVLHELRIHRKHLAIHEGEFAQLKSELRR